ncbi:Hypothetical_protein [Hexamita inflata]|uniref:Hypothetical_protein n=1 Tax=Hexamita inflata TaxID=28002 RepID=A0ABP1HWU8_9EUKA
MEDYYYADEVNVSCNNKDFSVVSDDETITVTCPNTNNLIVIQEEYPEEPVVQAQEVERVANRQRKLFSLELKQKVIKKYLELKFLKKRNVMKETVKYFQNDGIEKENIKTFLKNKDEILEEEGGNLDKRWRIKEGKSYVPTFEKHLVEYVNTHDCITISDLRQVTEALRASLPPDHPEYGFKCSNGYIEKFLKRQELSLQVPCRTKQLPPQDQITSSLNGYLQSINNVVAKFNLTQDSILGMDETSVCKQYGTKKFVGKINHGIYKPGTHEYNMTASNDQKQMSSILI